MLFSLLCGPLGYWSSDMTNSSLDAEQKACFQRGSYWLTVWVGVGLTARNASPILVDL